MSKLMDKLKLTSPSARQPMGFGQSKLAPAKPKMVLIASFSQTKPKKLVDFVAGADAGLWHISSVSEIDSLHETSLAIADFIWGWWVTDLSQDALDKTMKLGDDFLVFSTDSPIVSIRDDKLGRILQIELSISDSLLRTINDLPADAVLVTAEVDEAPVITWQHLMSLRRVSGLLRKPVLVTISPDATAAELQSLWDAGVDGIVSEVDLEKPPGKINELRQMIDGLVYPKTRPQGKLDPLLPQAKPDTIQASEDEEEEDEDL
ncbi:hypothetical protein ACFLVE_01580 [Chloroflexota bacterium]